ncbi:hypothetical protein PTKIN_Ptkin08bG0058600 [Pterospermum kingtungense]
MVNNGLIELSSLEDPLFKAFAVLGLDPLTIRLRRGDNVGFSLAEFYDDLGNRLYLDTDLDEYEKKGQEISASVFSASLKGLSTSRSYSQAGACLFEKMPKLVNRLDEESLNLHIQALCKTGLAYGGVSLFYRMLWRGLIVNSETHTTLTKGLCKRGILSDLHGFWDVAQNNKWLPAVENCNALFQCLSHQGMLEEALELFEGKLVSYPQKKQEVCHIFLENLCIAGFRALLEGFCMKGKLGEAGHLIRGVIKGSVSLTEFMLAKSQSKSLVSYNILLFYLLSSGNILAVNKVLKELQVKELPPNEVTYDFLVYGFSKCREMSSAVHYLFTMICKGLRPSSRSLRMVISHLCDIGDLKNDLELSREMESRGWIIVQLFNTELLWVSSLMVDLKKLKVFRKGW